MLSQKEVKFKKRRSGTVSDLNCAEGFFWFIIISFVTCNLQVQENYIGNCLEHAWPTVACKLQAVFLMLVYYMVLVFYWCFVGLQFATSCWLAKPGLIVDVEIFNKGLHY